MYWSSNCQAQSVPSSVAIVSVKAVWEVVVCFQAPGAPSAKSIISNVAVWEGVVCSVLCILSVSDSYPEQINLQGINK